MDSEEFNCNLHSISGNSSKAIKPINTDTVHKICSGQVVLNLAVAVKELVENSLDAGATNVDIRLKNYGIDMIEVADNGSGVTDDNFAGLTLKYHTSKLNEYSDLLGVDSFGFRGEALSSLCALADLTITTRHKTAEYATKVIYDHKGNIVNKTPCSRQVGTTVTLTNLFSSLPVRQKEFHKNAKREFNKMTQLLYAYCLISLGVKITCHNQTGSNPKSLVVATLGSNSFKDNIASVFGLKQLQTVLEIKPEYTPNIKENVLKGLSGEVKESQEDVIIDDVEINLSEDSNDDNSESIPNSQKSSQGYKNGVCPIEFTGFISSCEHGCGRSSTDRQFYFVNSRPCEPVKVMKIINEIYRQYNSNQYPFVFLNVNLDRTSVDVNVTPDKRKVFLTKEKVVLDVLKSSLLKLFENIPRTMRLEPSSSRLGRILGNDVKPDVDQPRVFNAFIQKFANKCKSSEQIANDIEYKSNELKRKSTTMLDFVIATKTLKSNDVEIDKIDDEIFDKSNKEESNNYVTDRMINHEQIGTEIRTSDDSGNSTVDKNKDKSNKDKSSLKDDSTNDEPEIIMLGYTDRIPNTQIRSVADVAIEKSHTIYCKTKDNIHSKAKIHTEHETPTKKAEVVTDKEDLGKYNRRTINMKTSIEHVKALVNIYNQKKNKQTPEKVKFKTTINPVFNKKCEEELSREISKDSFKLMDIVGQFNLGFIITRLDDDLFIIDQHATDEIYNFETLQRTVELTHQKLVIPQQLELTGVNEQILMDNLDVFKVNGFTFDIDERAPPTKRVKLLTIPMSRNWVFGKEDVEELLFMLREGGPSSSAAGWRRPSRVRAMFASRACRRSVMVGAALAAADMRALVRHMADIDKPWNCPHGRPTIRHLVNLAMVHTED